MLPSRGITQTLQPMRSQTILSGRLASRTLPLRPATGRQFSTSLNKTGGVLQKGHSIRPRQYAAPIALGTVASSRNLSLWGWWSGSKKPTEEAVANKAASVNESAPAPAAAAPEPVLPPSTDPSTVTTSDLDLSAIDKIVSGEDILKLPEQIGYLKAMGIDFGNGPSSIMSWLLEHIHVYTGFGWGASIILTAFALRVVMFYPQVRSLKFNAIMQKLREDPRGKEAQALVKEAFAKGGDMELRQRSIYLNKMLKKEYGVSNFGMFWAFMQIPFTFGLFRVTSAMANIPLPSLESAGFLWFTDLTARDPYFVLPALGAALMTLSVHLNSKYTAEAQKKMMRPMMWVVGPLGFIVTTFLSAAVNLMALSFGASTLVTAIILNNHTVRKLIGLPTEIPGNAPQAIKYESPRPATEGNMRERLTANLNEMKKGVSDQVTNFTGSYSGTETERAERKRKELLRKLETTRREQEREEFEKKYKGRK